MAIDDPNLERARPRALLSWLQNHDLAMIEALWLGVDINDSFRGSMIARVTSQTLSAAVIGAVCSAFATPALAQANPCAIYGSGYVAVLGGEGCERIGERVRVESDTATSRTVVHGLPNGALGYAPHQPAGPAPAHMRSPTGGQWPGERQNNPRIR